MRIQYSPLIFVLLGVLITVSACQGDAQRMYMDVSDLSATSQSGKAHDASAMSLQVITDTLPVVPPKEASVETSSATPSPSNSAGGSPMSAQISPVQGIEAPTDAKPMEGISKASADEQAAPKYSSEDHENWFHEFVNAVENPEAWTWNDIEKVLDRGKPLGYLTRPIAWDDDEYTPLHYAAQEGDLEVVKELIEKHNISVDIRTGEHQRTPLHLSALEGNLETVKYLISKKADLLLTDTAKSNALHYAASGIKGENNTRVVKFLIEDKSANYKLLADDKFSLLYLAIKASNTCLVEYIAGNLPDLVSKKTCSISPLEFAKHEGNQAIIALIQNKLSTCQKNICEELNKN